MNVAIDPDDAVSRLAAAIAEPARTRMLLCLMDGRARTSTELAAVADVGASTASVHLQRLKTERLVEVSASGRHRYYRLAGPNVARALERLSILAGRRGSAFVPTTPSPLRAARTCYDHMAGTLAVELHDRLLSSGSIAPAGRVRGAYEVTSTGAELLAAAGVDVEATRAQRRRFAFACLDWSERRPHVAGALGAALLGCALRKRWVDQDLDSRALAVTNRGRREFAARFGLVIP